MNSFRTIQAVRQVIYSALTSPLITYSINGGSTLTLAASHVGGRSVWTPAVGGGLVPGSPYVNFSVGGGGRTQLLAERELRLRIWVSSDGGNESGDDETTEIYESIRARLHGADDEASGDWMNTKPPSLSRSATAQTYGVVIRRCREMPPGALAADYDKGSERWYVSATFQVIAI